MQIAQIANAEVALGVITISLLVIVALRGIRAAWAIHNIYMMDDRQPRSLILRTIRYGTFVKVVAAIWFMAWALIAIWVALPYELRLTRSVGSIILAALVLDLPSRYLKMVRQIERGSYD